MTPADLVKLAKSAKSGKKVASGLSAASEAATISNMQQAGALPLPKLINTPQSAALKLAQERAALPVSKGGLGLPKNNTPAQRAKAMGIKTDAYHGTKQDITGAFQPGYDDDLAFVTKSPDFANKWIGKGKHTQRTGEEAKQEVKSAEDMYRDIKSRNVNYDDQLERLKGDEFNAEYDRRSALARAESEKEFGTRGYPDQIHSTVYPLKVEANKTFNPESDMDVMAEFFEKNEIPQNLQDLYASGNYMMYETKPVVEYLKSKGYDSMRLRESTGDDYPTIAVFNPETVRSRFAAFDPFRKDVATATAMGVAAPDLLAKEKESKEEKSRKAQGGLIHMAGGGATRAEIDAMKFALAQRANKGVARMEVGGQARTRAGTIAKPTFIDEQLAKTSERLSKLYNDPDQALRDIARQYFPSSTDTPAQQQQKLEDLALGFAGSIKTPKAPKSPSSTGGDYLPGVHYADPLQAPTMRMSEALGNVGAEGKTLRFTEADRSRVFGPNRGGVGFSALQHYSIPHKEARTVWGYGNESTARKKINQNDPNSTIWSTYAGSPTQHKSNTVVVKDAIKTLQDANKAGAVNPEQIKLINYRIQQAVNDKGKPLFPEGFDITDPKALSHATTFDRRSVISDALMGVGVKKPMRSVEFKEANPGVVWSDASNIESILSRETDPALVNANTFDVGPNLFTIENQVIHRPDLNEAFPYQVTGEDLGMRFEPTPFRLAAPEFTKDIPIDEAINAWKMSRGNPSQFVSEEYLTNMQKEGYKDGGVVHMEGGGFLDKLKEELGLQYESLKKPGAVTDIINRGVVAPVMGAAADIPNMALEGVDWLQSKIPNLRKQASVMDTQNPIPQRQDPAMGYVPKFPLATDEPYGGTAHAQRLMREANMTSSTERPLMEAVAGIAAPFSPAAALKAIKAGKAMAPRAGALLERAAAKGQPMPLEMNVMKPKGGNWLAGSIERVTEPMKSYVPSEESLLRAEAVIPAGAAEARARSMPDAVLNKWIDKKLNSYIKNEMGTPEDQIRLGIERRAAEAETLKETNQAKLDKMAAAIERNKAAGKDTTLTERDLEAARDKFDEEYQIASEGLYHGTVPVGGWMGGNVWEPQILAYKREKEGFPKGGMGTHPAARQWEFASDAEIGNSLAKDMQAEHLQEAPLSKENEWINKVSPETKIYRLDEMAPDVYLEFRHMIDEVKTAMDPASNLPKHLKIAAKDLEKMTVDDVSALSGKISAWRNAQIGKPNLELANNPAVSLYKEYPAANNPKGVSWRQIKRPEGLPDEEADKALRDAIGYEGDIMRHCVGGSGHCEPLLRGETEVYSLRDAKGEPHVTIEVGRAQGQTGYEDMQAIYGQATQEANQNNFATSREWNNFYNERVKELQFEFLDKQAASLPKQIVEIKGKNNRKPKDEYIPFIQDFIRSGNWSNVRDMHHTDLRQLSTGKYATDQELKSLLSRHYPDNPGMTPTNAVEHYDLMKKHPEYQDEAAKRFIQDLESGNYFAPPEGMKRGGAVRMAAGGSPDPYQDDEDMSLDEKKFALLKAKQKKAVIKPMAASPDSINELRASLGLPDQEIEYRDAGLGGALQLNTYSKERSKEMFPKQYGIDDQRDAARHMIAAGTLARKFNPSVARFVGKGYEFLSSPATSIGYGLGLNEMPPDYAMDIYNNELGIELARKAKTQEEFERLVNMSATGALPEKSPGRAMIIPTKKK